MAHLFSVRELTQAVRDVLEGEFPFVWVRGQVSNLTRPASGHVYFTLKDEEAVLSVVWFRKSQWPGGEGCVHPLTGEVCEGGPFELADGLEVLVAGRLTVYAPRGTYQLVAELVQEEGAGRLARAFEELKRELAALGYFDQARKRPLPRNPARVAVVTAPTGAAVRDFLRLAEARGAGCRIRIHPTQVQGEAAPGQIVTALRAAATDGFAQVVALVRGGGSLEDLAAFNCREVARAVFECPLPVVVGVGHEVDVSIADLVADVRAATPSHAAQLIWPERSELAQRVDEAGARLNAAFGRLLAVAGHRLEAAEKGLTWLSPARSLERARERLGRLEAALPRAFARESGRRDERLAALAARLGRLAPQLTGERARALARAAERLDAAGTRLFERLEDRLEGLQSRLVSADPHAPLARGYALVRRAADGALVRAAAAVSPGTLLDIRLGRGSLEAEVQSVRPEGEMP